MLLEKIYWANFWMPLHAFRHTQTSVRRSTVIPCGFVEPQPEALQSTHVAMSKAASYALQEKQNERMQQLEKRLQQPDYADKTPSDVQQKDAEKLQKYQTELAAVIDQIAQSRKFLGS